jgi:hypothetical protein
MNPRTNTIVTVVGGLLLTSGVTLAQVGPDGNLAFTTSASQFAVADNPPDFIVRNRLDSGCCWTAFADALLLQRTGGKTSTLMITPSGSELLNSNAFNFPVAVGPRLGIVGEDILFGCDVEALYFAVDGWDITKSVLVPDEGAYFNLFNEQIGLLDPGTVVDYRYISRLHNAEINVRHPIWERLYFLMGFRYLQLHEDFAATILSPLVPDADGPFADANVDNNLYGGQIGLNVAFISTHRLSIEGVLKAGVFGNYADLTMTVGDSLLGDKTTHTSVLGEIGLMGIVQVAPHLSLRGGYQVLWLDGIAIASDQFENVNPADPKPYMGGTLFYHGAFAGLEYAF